MSTPYGVLIGDQMLNQTDTTLQKSYSTNRLVYPITILWEKVVIGNIFDRAERRFNK